MEFFEAILFDDNENGTWVFNDCWMQIAQHEVLYATTWTLKPFCNFTIATNAREVMIK
jgi:hypothetical protein